MEHHPLLADIASLRQSAARFQHEAHAAAARLQRQSLDAARLRDHTAALEYENARLAAELDDLRKHPDAPPHPAVHQAQELTLALRRVSDKIILTEDALLTRTAELTDARNELVRATHTTDAAYELAARMRAREEAANARARELEFMARAAQEERRMADLVVQEYADLVRTLEGRKPSNSAISLQDALQEGRSSLQTALSTDADKLRATIAELGAQMSHLQITLAAERSAAAHDRTLLTQARTQLDKLDLEDQTAAKMVTRYMKFSQASTNALQEQIMSLRIRHASTLTTLQIQLSVAESQLETERAHSTRLQDALDELCQDLARESYGRRREIALRLALLSREETVAEFLRRWARRATESYARCYPSLPSDPQNHIQEAFHRVVSDAVSLLSSLDEDIQISDSSHVSGSLSRIIMSREAVDALRNELQDETRKRVEAIRKLSFPDDSLPGGHSHEGPIDDPFLVGSQHDSAPTTFADNESNLRTPSATVISASTSITLLPDEEPKAASPVPTEGPDQSTAEHDRPNSSTEDSLNPEVDAPTEDDDDLGLPTEEPAPVTSNPPLQNHESGVSSILTIKYSSDVATDDDDAPPTPASLPDLPYSALLAELEDTKHRYDFLQRAFRDCSVALKDLQHTLPSASLSHDWQTTLRQHLATALARIDDYSEDARVELEIRIADEALTARGFATVLSMPGGAQEHVDADERAEIIAGARAFVDGSDDGVRRALDKFGGKLADVEHDVAVVKRAVHALAIGDEDGILECSHEEGEEVMEASEEEETDKEESGDKDAANSSWTSWTAGLLGTSMAPTTPSRSPTPVQTFGNVITSPRPRHLQPPSSRSRVRRRPPGLGGPLAGLNLRVPMPVAFASSPFSFSSSSSSFSHSSSTSPFVSAGTEQASPYGHLGLGRTVRDGPGRMGAGGIGRTLSAMYAVGGLRSPSNVGLGVGVGAIGGLGGGGSSPLAMRRTMPPGASAGASSSSILSLPLRLPHGGDTRSEMGTESGLEAGNDRDDDDDDDDDDGVMDSDSNSNSVIKREDDGGDTPVSLVADLGGVE